MSADYSSVTLIEILGVPVIDWRISDKSTPEDSVRSINECLDILGNLEFPVYEIADISKVNITEMSVGQSLDLYAPIVNTGKLELLITIIPQDTHVSKGKAKVLNNLASIVNKGLKGKISHAVCYSRREAELILAKWLASKQKQAN